MIGVVGEGTGPVRVEEVAVGDEGRTAAVVTLARPEQLNAIDWDMLRALDAALDEVAARTAVCAVLVTGAGRAFSAGGDLKSYMTLQRDPILFPRFVADIHRVFDRLRRLPVPAIALVNGVAAAGGLELILNCDLVLVARSARIGDGHLNFGQMGGGGVLTLLPRMIGLQRAAELIFTGRFLSADEAVAWGLALRAVEDDALLGAGLDLAAMVATKSPLAIANAKDVLQTLWCSNGDVSGGLRFELERDAVYCLTSEDAREGLSAFAEKRTPRFTGR
jgi:enoyl-CoA hydratase/carnithine racemase